MMDHNDGSMMAVSHIFHYVPLFTDLFMQVTLSEKKMNIIYQNVYDL